MYREPWAFYHVRGAILNEHEAAEALHRIERGLSLDRPDLRKWLSAFENIQWIAVAEGGYCLTEAGLEALRDFSRKFANLPTKRA